MADRNYEVEHAFNKHVLFVNNPMEEKPVTCIPGIEDTLGERLQEQGLTYAYEVYNQFLFLRKDKLLFQYWMYRMCAATRRESGDAFSALTTWDSIHTKCIRSL